MEEELVLSQLNLGSSFNLQFPYFLIYERFRLIHKLFFNIFFQHLETKEGKTSTNEFILLASEKNKTLRYDT